jgi:hypothetical protein
MLDGLEAIFNLVDGISNLIGLVCEWPQFPIRFGKGGTMITQVPDLPIPPVMASAAAATTARLTPAPLRARPASPPRRAR